MYSIERIHLLERCIRLGIEQSRNQHSTDSFHSYFPKSTIKDVQRTVQSAEVFAKGGLRETSADWTVRCTSPRLHLMSEKPNSRKADEYWSNSLSPILSRGFGLSNLRRFYHQAAWCQLNGSLIEPTAGWTTYGTLSEETICASSTDFSLQRY